MIVWLNGTHGVGKTTTGALVQRLLPEARAFDAEKVGETLMSITPGLPDTDNFQHWPPWRPLVVDTARRVLGYTGGILVMPMHADHNTLRERIEGDTVLGPSSFRLRYLGAYADAASTWLHREAEVIDTTSVTPAQAAQQIADAVNA